MRNLNFNKLKKTFLTAEIGINHNGSEELAFKMLNEAKKTGVDAIKFQTFRTDDYISIDEKDRFNRTKKCELDRSFFEKIFLYSKKKNIISYSTPFGLDDLNFIKTRSPIIKIASGEITYNELIYKAALTKKPLILSTGLATESEIDNAIKIIIKANPKVKKDGKLLLLHCVSGYPTPINEINLASIRFLENKFNLPVGFSDHSLEEETSFFAVLAGAVAIEKHFTLNKKDKFIRDHAISFEPKEFKSIIKKIKNAEIVLGNKEKFIQSSEKKNFKYLRRSVAAAIDIEAGTKIKKSHIKALRPLYDIPIENMEMILGKKININIKKNQIIKKSFIK